ncbi:hypothetical protein Tco_0927518 [Tanacetum coccineum]
MVVTVLVASVTGEDGRGGDEVDMGTGRRWLWWPTCGVGGAVVGGGRGDDGDVGCEVWRWEMIVVVGCSMVMVCEGDGVGWWPESGQKSSGRRRKIRRGRSVCLGLGKNEMKP